MRADAEKNYHHLLAVAREAVCEHGAETSLRDIARKAGVGLATLYRHFPTREALLEAILRERLDTLTADADRLDASDAPDKALASWFQDGLAFTRSYAGVVALMAAALDDDQSALHASCSAVRSAGARLLERAQNKGLARTEIDGTGLFALMGALAWIADQPAFASRTDHLARMIIDTLLTDPADSPPRRINRP